MAVKLSKRLAIIAKYISPGSFFADIGSDHAYLPCHICLHDSNAQAVAGEVAEGPFNRALQTVQHFNLTKQIDVRLGDGLGVIKGNEQLGEIIIAGMGGTLISNILKEGVTVVKETKRLLLQPNTNAITIRKLLREIGFTLHEEIILEENNHFYEILIAGNSKYSHVKSPYNPQMLEKQLFFGPYLLQQKTDVFINKWRNEYEKIKKTVLQMQLSKQKNNEKIEAFTKQMKWIEEEIS